MRTMRLMKLEQDSWALRALFTPVFLLVEVGCDVVMMLALCALVGYPHISIVTCSPSNQLTVSIRINGSTVKLLDELVVQDRGY